MRPRKGSADFCERPSRGVYPKSKCREGSASWNKMWAEDGYVPMQPLPHLPHPLQKSARLRAGHQPCLEERMTAAALDSLTVSIYV